MTHNNLPFKENFCKLFYNNLERFIMSRLFSSIVFSFFLLFQTTSIAEEDTTPTETNVEVQETEVPQEAESIEPKGEQEPKAEVQKEVEPTEALSEAEKEAQAAEAAELRESGVFEEPVVE